MYCILTHFHVSLINFLLINPQPVTFLKWNNPPSSPSSFLFEISRWKLEVGQPTV